MICELEDDRVFLLLYILLAYPMIYLEVWELELESQSFGLFHHNLYEPVKVFLMKEHESSFFPMDISPIA